MKVAFLNPPELGVALKGHYIFTDDGRRFGPMTAAQAVPYSKEPIDVVAPPWTEPESDAIDDLEDAQVTLPSPHW